MRKLKNRNIFLIFTIILSLGITLGAVYFMYQYRDSRENSLSTGLISLKFTDQSNTINLSSNVPMIDDLGLKNTPYEFTIENTSKVPINVDIKVDVDNNTSIHLGAVRYGLYIDDKLVKKDYIHNDLILYTYEELLRDESINCKIKFWVDYYYDRPNQTFIGKIKAEGSSRDKLYNGVTVTFDEGNIFTVADGTYSGLDISYDEETEIMTINGTTNNNRISLGYIYKMLFYEGDSYDFNLEHISGNISVDETSGTGGIISSIVIDVCKNGYALSSRNNGRRNLIPDISGGFPLTINSTAVQEGNSLEFWLWNNGGYNYTFNNYKVKISFKKLNKETKEVGVGDTYGRLPTPTRDGYTFMGWNGKNLAIFSPGILSENRIQNGITWHAKSENVVHISGTATGDSFLTEGMGSTSINLRKLSAGTYTISSNLVRTNSENVYIYGYYNGDTSSTTYASGIINNRPKTFTISENSGTNIQMMINSGTTIDQEVWVQLEKGTIATEYEPYYITSKTKVVQKGNHTLKAIWKKNS